MFSTSSRRPKGGAIQITGGRTMKVVKTIKEVREKPAGRICEGSHENYKNRGSIGKTDP